jgi:hypothetical protein
MSFEPDDFITSTLIMVSVRDLIRSKHEGNKTTATGCRLPFVLGHFLETQGRGNISSFP